MKILFQFLMVRLKATFDDVLKWEFDISIPYGAIKSMQLGIWFEYKCTFQFLMVRLKDYDS